MRIRQDCRVIFASIDCSQGAKRRENAHETAGRRSTDASGTMGDRVKEMRSQPTTDTTRTPDRGGWHAVDVVVEIMRGRERDRSAKPPSRRESLDGRERVD